MTISLPRPRAVAAANVFVRDLRPDDVVAWEDGENRRLASVMTIGGTVISLRTADGQVAMKDPMNRMVRLTVA